MNWRGNLFVKIFFGFWLVTTAMLGSWMLSTWYFDSRPAAVVGGPVHRGPPHRFMLRLIYELQNAEQHELEPLLQRVHNQYHISIYLLRRSGQDLFNRPVPRAVSHAAQQLHGGRRRARLNTPREHLLAHTLYRPEQGRLYGVFVFPLQRHQLLGALGSNLWLRIAVAVLVAGAVCYGLSRLVTNRLRRMQLAARRLAGGELDTRLAVRVRGGDETDELARDFNSMAAQLQERIQAQKRLLTDVSHELRSPLARLRIALALAQQDTVGSGAYLQRIERETQRLEELIDQLLSSQTGAIELDTHIDLVGLLQQLCADASFEGEPQGRRFVFDSTAQQALVATSGDLLRRSFENLLRNALRHTPDDSRVRVSLDGTRDGWAVTIEDRGPGVPEAELERIFDEFYRVDSARSRDSGGHGLGLAIARRAIERHGGTVSARNTGSGLLVEVILPANHGTPEPPSGLTE
ncbi:MAG: HAMP domain-containing protein [Halioglobus sp.]|nr:HAMP domain-containing protein [Halioglobus sp.]